MTKDKASEILTELWRYANKFSNKDAEEALYMAIESLEKEPILDKIEKEIKELDDKVCQQFLIEDIDKEVHHTYQKCLKIIQCERNRE